MRQGGLVARVKVRLPALLAGHAGGRRELQVEAATIGEALAAARDALPTLRRLIDDEEGSRRPHVNVFYNDVEEDHVEDPAAPARDTDEILIIQSVSGG